VDDRSNRDNGQAAVTTVFTGLSATAAAAAKIFIFIKMSTRVTRFASRITYFLFFADIHRVQSDKVAFALSIGAKINDPG